MIKVKPYLKRIGYSGSTEPTLETLTRLQYQHLLTIPFENLDIHYGNPITLNVSSFYRKIVKNGRGGFCYELNGLFHALLQKLGFKAKMVSARVYEEETATYSPEFDHLAILVNSDEKGWLVDVGFGDFIYAPLNLDKREAQKDPGGVFRIRNNRPDYLILEQQHSKAWKPEYKFSTASRKLIEFNKRALFHQTSDESHFSEKKVCSVATPAGRITLTDKKLKITKYDNSREHPETDKQEFETLLKSISELNWNANSNQQVYKS